MTLLSVPFGNERLTLDDATTRLLTQLLLRLPPSLYKRDLDDETLQQVLYTGLAAELGQLLESQGVANASTLLQQAEGIDLDVLLRDYGLKRYNDRPDAFAREIGRHILGRPKGTLLALSTLAGLMAEQPTLTLRSGRQEVHTWIADTQPVLAYYSYWELSGEDGRLWKLWVKPGGSPMVSDIAPPGANVTPAGPQLHWIVLEADDAPEPWYLTITPSGSYRVSPTQPPWGVGSADTFATLDGNEGLWGLEVHSATQTLVSAVLDASAPPVTILAPVAQPFTYVWVNAPGAVPYALRIVGGVLVTALTAPVGAVDVTPPGGPFTWLRLAQRSGARWWLYLAVGGIIHVTQTPQAGVGAIPPELWGDASNRRWRVGIDADGVLAYSNAPRLVFDDAATYVVLNDRHGKRWCWWIDPNRPTYVIADVIPPGMVSETPMGEIGWYQMLDANGDVRYLYPNTLGYPTTNSAPPLGSVGGIVARPTLHDRTGQPWYLDITSSDAVQVTPGVTETLPHPATPLHVRDVADALDHVKSVGTLTTVYVS